MTIKNLTTEQLEEKSHDLHEQIDNECGDESTQQEYDNIIKEIERRG